MSARQHISGQFPQLAGRELSAQKLHADVVELVGFVKHHHLGRGQQFGHAGFAHIQVGKEEVVIDHHHIGIHRLASRQVHVAI